MIAPCSKMLTIAEAARLILIGVRMVSVGVVQLLTELSPMIAAVTVIVLSLVLLLLLLLLLVLSSSITVVAVS